LKHPDQKPTEYGSVFSRDGGVQPYDPTSEKHRFGEARLYRYPWSSLVVSGTDFSVLKVGNVTLNTRGLVPSESKLSPRLAQPPYRFCYIFWIKTFPNGLVDVALLGSEEPFLKHAESEYLRFRVCRTQGLLGVQLHNKAVLHDRY
jgi:hypothetical protein